jgi:hypothetical protein
MMPPYVTVLPLACRHVTTPEKVANGDPVLNGANCGKEPEKVP